MQERHKRRIILTGLFSGIFFIGVSFQNCSEVQFSPSKLYGNALEGLSDSFEFDVGVEEPAAPVIPVDLPEDLEVEVVEIIEEMIEEVNVVEPVEEVVEQNEPQDQQEEHAEHSPSSESQEMSEEAEMSSEAEVVSESDSVSEPEMSSESSSDSAEDNSQASQSDESSESASSESESSQQAEVAAPPAAEVAAPPAAESADQIDSACGVQGLSDVRVNIREVYLGQTAVSSVYGVRSLADLAEGIPVYVATATRAQQLNIVLEIEGNQLVDVDGRSFALQTPSAQQSGLKIALGSQRFEANSDYLIQFDMDSVKIVQAGKSGRCILTPTLKGTGILKVSASN